MAQKTIQEQSAGGVVFRKTGSRYEFLLGKHSGYHKWVLPKGMQEQGETLLETAVREIWEEVGVKVTIVFPEPVKVIAYDYVADMQDVIQKNPHAGDTVRRVVKYQEEGGGSVEIHKEVTYYLMELVEDSGRAGWEMEDRRWVSYEEGMQLLSFESERNVFVAAQKVLITGASDQT